MERTGVSHSVSFPNILIRSMVPKQSTVSGSAGVGTWVPLASSNYFVEMLFLSSALAYRFVFFFARLPAVGYNGFGGIMEPL